MCETCERYKQETADKHKELTTIKQNILSLKAKLFESSDLIKAYVQLQHQNEELNKENDLLKNKHDDSMNKYQLDILKQKLISSNNQVNQYKLAYEQLKSLVEQKEINVVDALQSKNKDSKLRRELSEKDKVINSQNLIIETLKKEKENARNQSDMWFNGDNNYIDNDNHVKVNELYKENECLGQQFRKYREKYFKYKIMYNEIKHNYKMLMKLYTKRSIAWEYDDKGKEEGEVKEVKVGRKKRKRSESVVDDKEDNDNDIFEKDQFGIDDDYVEVKERVHVSGDKNKGNDSGNITKHNDTVNKNSHDDVVMSNVNSNDNKKEEKKEITTITTTATTSNKKRKKDNNTATTNNKSNTNTNNKTNTPTKTTTTTIKTRSMDKNEKQQKQKEKEEHTTTTTTTTTPAPTPSPPTQQETTPKEPPAHKLPIKPHINPIKKQPKPPSPQQISATIKAFILSSISPSSSSLPPLTPSLITTTFSPLSTLPEKTSLLIETAFSNITSSNLTQTTSFFHTFITSYPPSSLTSPNTITINLIEHITLNKRCLLSPSTPLFNFISLLLPVLFETSSNISPLSSFLFTLTEEDALTHYNTISLLLKPLITFCNNNHTHKHYITDSDMNAFLSKDNAHKVYFIMKFKQRIICEELFNLLIKVYSYDNFKEIETQTQIGDDILHRINTLMQTFINNNKYSNDINLNDVFHLEMLQLITLCFRFKPPDWVYNYVFDNIIWKNLNVVQNDVNKRVLLLYYSSYYFYLATRIDDSFDADKKFLRVYMCFHSIFANNVFSIHDKVLLMCWIAETSFVTTNASAKNTFQTAVDMLVSTFGVDKLPNDFVNVLKQSNFIK